MVIGRKIGNALKLPGLRLKAEPDRCIKCEVCSNNCLMSLDVMEMVLVNQMENSECVLCGICVDQCPKDVIRYSFGRAKFE
jgi:Pyruvate/2-oxoacid:ferredoxin oxidoreductase delta subunit